MFSENLRTLRKAKGLSQEELAIRLNVVRQTISKWEKGLSVPDADLLIRLSDVFEVSVSGMLGARIENEQEINAVAEQLSRINEQLAIKNRRARRVWKTVAIIFFAFVIVGIILIFSSVVAFNNFKFESGAVEVTDIEADYIPYKEIPPNYSLENAKNDNIVVYENGNITSGQSIWDTFVAKAETRTPCAVRLGFYYTLDDPSRYSPEHYEEIKGDYPVLYILDLSFGGDIYTLYSVEDGIEYSPQYRYLKQFTEESPPISATFTKREMCILVNDNEVTWEQIQHGMFSSQFGDYIDHRTVYSKYTYK